MLAASEPHFHTALTGVIRSSCHRLDTSRLATLARLRPARRLRPFPHPASRAHICDVSIQRLSAVPHAWYHGFLRGGKEENYSFLPLVHNVIKCMDKDSPDLHQDLNALKTKFQEMRKLIGTMPGIHMSPEQQQQQLHSLREQVRTKNELLQKYKSLCMFEIPKE
ncbi:mediator complex subunit 9 [Cricetulus griseus]